MTPSQNSSTKKLLELQSVDPTQDLYSDVAWIIEALSHSTGLSTSECHERLMVEYRQVGHLVTQELRQLGIEPYRWSSGLANFYQTSKSFLFESLVWNSSQVKMEARRWIGARIAKCQKESPRVLVYGDGPGIDSLYFAWRDFQVDYFDVAQPSRFFAKQLFAKYAVQVGMPSHDVLKDNHYDAIICLDVLEHLPDPVAAVVEMKRLLTRDGMLFIHAPFWYLAPNVSTHLRSNLKYSGDIRKLYSSNGLQVIDSAAFWNPLVLQKRESMNSFVRTWSTWRRFVLHGLLFKISRIHPKPLAWAVRKFFSSKPASRWMELEAYQTNQ